MSYVIMEAQGRYVNRNGNFLPDREQDGRAGGLIKIT